MHFLILWRCHTCLQGGVSPGVSEVLDECAIVICPRWLSPVTGKSAWGMGEAHFPLLWTSPRGHWHLLLIWQLSAHTETRRPLGKTSNVIYHGSWNITSADPQSKQTWQRLQSGCWARKQESLGTILWASILVILLLLLPNNLLPVYCCIFARKILFTGITCITLHLLLVFRSLFLLIFFCDSCTGGTLLAFDLPTLVYIISWNAFLSSFIFFLANSIEKQEFPTTSSASFPIFFEVLSSSIWKAGVKVLSSSHPPASGPQVVKPRGTCHGFIYTRNAFICFSVLFLILYVEIWFYRV